MSEIFKAVPEKMLGGHRLEAYLNFRGWGSDIIQFGGQGVKYILIWWKWG